MIRANCCGGLLYVVNEESIMSHNLQSAVLALVQQYVNRQQLVSAIIHELRPDLVIMSEQNERTLAWLERLKEQQGLVASTPQKGYWGANQEWKYFFHGGGCGLIQVLPENP